MLDIIIAPVKANMLAQNSLIATLQTLNLNGTLYVGYPILASADHMVTINALLTTLEHGVVAIDFADGASESVIRERQDSAFNAVFRKLLAFKPLIVKRELAVKIAVLTYAPSELKSNDPEVLLAGPESLASTLAEFAPISPEMLTYVNAAIQQISTIKPANKREGLAKADSRGAIMQKIEREIANLDKWQKTAAIECPDGPQRIRGLAGSGKTIVLALKAAFLHSANPEWDIAVTFHSRALYQQFKDLIRRFCYEYKNDEPDWTKLKILHAWGSARQAGVYSEIAAQNDIDVRDVSYARERFIYENMFGGVCDELLTELKKKGNAKELFDAVLIDEAQDLPRSFFEACFLSARPPKRVVWAYDELQNLGSYSMAPPAELFGSKENGEARVPNLNETPGTARRDIVLPVCYRNTPWVLTSAHAIGFGIYRPKGLVQFFDDPSLWQEIGYKVTEGQFEPGNQVALQRSENSYPSYFSELLNPADSMSWARFSEPEEQYRWIARQIQGNLEQDELQHTDILIVIPDALSSKHVGGRIIAALDEYDISAHLAGVTSSVDRLYQPGSVAISSIFRAKGNEAAMVYVVNSEYAVQSFQASKARNVLFTAITRSRAWVRVCGCGEGMDAVVAELQQVANAAYQLRFQVPTALQLEKIRRIHRDMPEQDIARQKTAVKNAEQLIAMIESGELSTETLPETFLRRFQSAFGATDDSE
ncbi:MAG: DEAD/DEAH box helicase [Acidobacteria bacterium]|nr:DEAD/DEAH box helicase [Acidobacteriota bacterium]